MTTQSITIDQTEFPVIVYKNLRVVTTELLAQAFGTDKVRIRQNHSKNKDRFIEGKHFFKIVGDELKEFASSLKILTNFSKVRSLILWTDRGAARHAKMLETDAAWDMFEKMEDCYFGTVQTQYGLKQLPSIPAPRAKVHIKGGLELHQQDAINDFIKERLAVVPEPKRKGIAVMIYSAICIKFGVKGLKHGYKNIAPEHFDNIMQLIARLPIHDEKAMLFFTQDELDALIQESVKALPNDSLLHVTPLELDALVAERVKAIEGELLPHHTNDKILSEEDWACLFVVHEETQHLITELKPVIDILSSITLLHVPLYLKNLQTVTDKLHSRFGEQMTEAAEKTGLFARKNWQPVPGAVKLDAELPVKPAQHNSITLNLVPITDGKMKRFMVTQHPEGRVDFWALTPEQKTFTESEYIDCLRYKGYIVAKKGEYYIMERKDEVSVEKLVLDYIPAQLLPRLIEAAAGRLNRISKSG